MIRIAAFLLFFAPVDFTDSLAESGILVGLADSPSERLSPPHLLAPGAPPVLAFRYFDASDRGRFGSLGLMTDDAGH
jgi:hypothetical protein